MPFARIAVRISIFGESKVDEVAGRHGIPVIGRIPMDPKLAGACDAGTIELFDGNWLDEGLGSILV